MDLLGTENRLDSVTGLGTGGEGTGRSHVVGLVKREGIEDQAT